MLRTLKIRALQVVPVIVLVTFFATALTALIPGSPARAIYGASASVASIRAFNQEFGLNRPLLDQYWHWLQSAARGNFGVSYQTHLPVAQLILQHLPITVELAVLTLFFSLLVAIALASMSALWAGSRIDRLITGVSSVLLSAPAFVTCVAAVYFFAIRTGWFPVSGWVSLTQDPLENLRYVFLPVLTLSLSVAPLFIRVLRGDMVSVLNQDYILAARSRGLPERYILFRHVLRPSSPSLLTISGVAFGHLFGGSIIVETFFALPGIGYLVSQAVFSKDIPIVQALVVWVAVAYLVINLLIDVSLALIDPRVRSA